MTSDAMMPIGRSRLRVLRFFRGRRDGVEADVGEEHHRGRGHDAGPAIRRERRQFAGST